MKNYKLIFISYFILVISLFNNSLIAGITSSKSEIAKFNKDYKLLFIYSSSCGYCLKFAPILSEFANDNNIKVQSITVNGGKLPGFKNAEYDPNILSKYNIGGIPTMMIIKRSNGQASLFHEGSMSRNSLNKEFQTFINDNYR